MTSSPPVANRGRKLEILARGRLNIAQIRSELYGRKVFGAEHLMIRALGCSDDLGQAVSRWEDLPVEERAVFGNWFSGMENTGVSTFVAKLNRVPILGHYFIEFGTYFEQHLNYTNVGRKKFYQQGISGVWNQSWDSFVLSEDVLSNPHVLKLIFSVIKAGGYEGIYLEKSQEFSDLKIEVPPLNGGEGPCILTTPEFLLIVSKGLNLRVFDLDFNNFFRGKDTTQYNQVLRELGIVSPGGCVQAVIP